MIEGMPYARWREGKDPTRMGDAPRLCYTQQYPQTPDSAPSSEARPWCEACDGGFPAECYCIYCKGVDPNYRGRHAGCYCWLNRQMMGE